MFVVSFPYAVLQGGYWTLLAIIVVAYICCHTGKILVECLYEEDQYGQKIRVHCSYVDIANLVFGPRFGGRIVNVAQMIELLMTCILYILLCGDLIIGCFRESESPLDLSYWIMISAAFLLPCAFLQTLKSVSWFSFWCTVAHLVINAIILVYCFSRINDWKWSEVQVSINIWTFPISLGVVVFSYTSQIFVPTLEGNLIDRQKFNCMMHWTHFAAAVFKALFAYIGFLTFGNNTKEFITNNLPRIFRIAVNVFFVLKALLSYPLPYFASVELLAESFFRGRPKTIFPVCIDNEKSLKIWAVILRLLLVISTMLMAIFIPHFSLLMGLIGSFTGTMLSLIWPCYFHLYLKGRTMSWYAKLFDIIIIILGLLCLGIGIYYSGSALIRSYRGLPPDPHNPRIPYHSGQ
ncbi:vesicular inhibitory amino acid transporter-like [Mytilus californianus]|uniref:vesicular inhibitory amino acid transporter-like n=1 Tax=Mytilus californianus TaxID=6549 RepID=UPI002248742B|nr:vesicular inhibitory amino acid transporter-like [Mytilus californianus]